MGAERPPADVHPFSVERSQNPSFVLQKAGELKFEDRPEPRVSDPHDVVVRVQYTGICGSDVHYWVEGGIGPDVVREPMVLGHESSGVVHSVGEKVSSLKVGDRVAMEPGIPCRRCGYCKSGKYNLCRDVAFAATPPTDGTLCKYYLIPADFCYKLPDHVSTQEGALAEPLSVSVHIARQANVRPGDSVVVFGAGPVGLLCMAVAKSFGASKIIAVDLNQDRVNFAQSFAATGSFKPGRDEKPEDSAARMVDECGFDGGADVAIDATGAEVCAQIALHVLRPSGTYVQGGMGKPDITVPILAITAKEVTCKGSFRYGPGDYKLAIEMLSAGRYNFKELITKQVKFKDAEQAFHDAKQGKGIKILIEAPED